ncbi:unnamed protein product [Prorocentrum cordatum]|uniref:Uncharacterized protein n=1 Tax=Prorocentrum cordatum TaxID=2364126 RepID=A0ABN9ULR2_9DINO|nr:unnamed protein product [Polarella glacialis]
MASASNDEMGSCMKVQAALRTALPRPERWAQAARRVLNQPAQGSAEWIFCAPQWQAAPPRAPQGGRGAQVRPCRDLTVGFGIPCGNCPPYPILAPRS